MKSTAALAISCGRPPLPEPPNPCDQLGMGMSTRSDIYTRPDVYDMEYAGASNHDARFFASLVARVRPRRVLELACGSGRVTFTLAKALPMAEIVGLDKSIDMLGKAATARDAAEPSVRKRVSLVEGDMRDWPGTGDAFDAVVIACCSVSHLVTLDDRRRTWATAFRLLRPGGVFILDVRAPDLATLAEAQRVRPRAFVDLDIDATRWVAGRRGTVAAVHRHDLRAAPAARQCAPALRPVRPTRAGRAPRYRLRQPHLLPGRTGAVVSVDGLPNRAAIRRLPVRLRRPHVALCGDGGATPTSVRAPSVSAQTTERLLFENGERYGDDDSVHDACRRDLKAARSSAANSSGCSHAAKWPPLSASWK
jgi:SAM-dependent methyltransferase